VTVGEDPRRLAAGPPPRQQFPRQRRVDRRKPAPRVHELKLPDQDVLRGLSAELGVEPLVFRVDRRQVPRLRDHGLDVTEAGPLTGEHVGALRHAGVLQDLDRLGFAGGVRADPQAGAERAEAGPAEPGAHHVP
jgi:hypothetical protein